MAQRACPPPPVPRSTADNQRRPFHAHCTARNSAGAAHICCAQHKCLRRGERRRVTVTTRGTAARAPPALLRPRSPTERGKCEWDGCSCRALNPLKIAFFSVPATLTGRCSFKAFRHIVEIEQSQCAILHAAKLQLLTRLTSFPVSPLCKQENVAVSWLGLLGTRSTGRPARFARRQPLPSCTAELSVATGLVQVCE
jgi:hypothetical protein